MHPPLPLTWQVEVGSLRSQLSVLSSDKAMLEERLAATTSRLADSQVALNSATRELAGMQVARGEVVHTIGLQSLLWGPHSL